MSELTVDLGNLFDDYKGVLIDRLGQAREDEAAILRWGADQLVEAGRQWDDDNVSDVIFQDWIRTLTLVSIPAKTGALAKHESKQLMQDLLGGIFKGISILVRAI